MDESAERYHKLFKWMTVNDIKIVTAIQRNNGIINVHYLTTDDESGSFIVIEDDDN